jgi:phosphoglycolate phosphatase
MPRIDAYRTVVWDFNGTLLDDLGIGIGAINALLSRRAMPEIRSYDAYHEVFCFPIEEYYRRLGFDFSREPYEVLAVEWVKEYRARENTAPLRDGARSLLSRFRAHGLRQAVLSATEETMLREQLSSLGILPYFEAVIGRGDIYASDKVALAAANAHRFGDGRVLVIGDTVHDFAVAQAMNADCILVAAGHHSYEKLIPCGVPVVRDLLDCTALLLPER